MIAGSKPVHCQIALPLVLVRLHGKYRSFTKLLRANREPQMNRTRSARLGAVAARGRVVYDYRILRRYSARKPFAALSLPLSLDLSASV